MATTYERLSKAIHSELKDKLPTQWELRTYDVWGNADDGYEVNDSYRAGTHDFAAVMTAHNIGTDRCFVSAESTDREIKKVLGITGAIEVTGDDVNYYVNRKRDGYPLCELHCISHESLSPVRVKSDSGE